jgi:hypothetical protein
MRLPALAGAALYFAGVYRLSRQLFGERPILLPAVALLTLNPLVLDFLVAARGYSLALGFWSWALATVLPALEAPETGTQRQLMESGVALALSVTANLVFLVPAGLLAAFVVGWRVLKRKRPPEPVVVPKGKKKKVAIKDAPVTDRPSVWRYFVVPIACVALLFFLGAPLDLVTSGAFYVGVSTISESLRNLAASSLQHGGPLMGARVESILSAGVAFGLAPLIVLAALAIGLRERAVLLLIVASSAIGSAVILVILHVAAALPYPVDRTGIYLLVLVALALAGLMACGLRAARFGASVTGVLLIVLFVMQFNVRKFLVWEYDADTKELAARIAQLSKDKPPGSVKLTASWQLDPSLNFYRETNHWDWLQRINRAPIVAGARFYALIAADRAAIGSLGLQILYRGPISGTVLAAPAQ